MLVVTITVIHSPSVDDETAERETTLGIFGAHYRKEDLEHRHSQVQLCHHYFIFQNVYRSPLGICKTHDYIPSFDELLNDCVPLAVFKDNQFGSKLTNVLRDWKVATRRPEMCVVCRPRESYRSQRIKTVTSGMIVAESWFFITTRRPEESLFRC